MLIILALLAYNPGGKSEPHIRQLLSIKENICAERPRKSYALQDAKKIFFSLYHQKDEIHSFPAMYNTWGSSLGRMGQKHDFVRKNALKTASLGDTILDRLASEGAGTPILKKIATFSMFPFNFGP